LPHEGGITHLCEQGRKILRENVDFSKLQIEAIGVDDLT
jgi:hypothetical protein